MSGRRLLLAAGACWLALAAAGLLMPKWLSFLVTMAAANGLVSLGIVGLMRGGVVPFGQGHDAGGGRLRRGAAVQQGRPHRRAGAHAGRRPGRRLGGGTLRTAAVSLPRHLLRHAHPGAQHGHLRPADEGGMAGRQRRLQPGPAHDGGLQAGRCLVGLRAVPADRDGGAGDGAGRAHLLSIPRVAWSHWPCATTNCGWNTWAARCARP